MNGDIGGLFDHTIYVHLIDTTAGKRLRATIHLPGRERSDPIRHYRRLRGAHTPLQQRAAVEQFRDLMIERYGQQLCALPKDEYTTLSAFSRSQSAALLRLVALDSRVAAMEARLAALEGNPT